MITDIIAFLQSLTDEGFLTNPVYGDPSPAVRPAGTEHLMCIFSEGDLPDTLIDVEVGFAAKAMLHTTGFSADGAARMKYVEALEIVAGVNVLLEQGGDHIMLMG